MAYSNAFVEGKTFILRI